MKIISLLIYCLIITPKNNCQEIEEPSMVYAVDGQIFTRKFGVSKKLTGFVRAVTDLRIYNGYLYVSVKRSEAGKRNSGIWWVKVTSNDSISFDDVKDSDWEEFDVVNSSDANIQSMTIANGYIYSGRSDAVIWKCSADIPQSCQNLHFNDGFCIDSDDTTDQKYYEALSIFDQEFYNCSHYRKTFSSDSDKREIAIAGIEYNPLIGKINAVISIYNKPYSMYGWHHQLEICSPDKANSCDYEPFVLSGWATLHAAFEALWIADRGLLRKCGILGCFLFHEFDGENYGKISASSGYVYVRLGSGNRFWRCDPNRRKSCTESFEIKDYSTNIGPFTFI